MTIGILLVALWFAAAAVYLVWQFASDALTGEAVETVPALPAVEPVATPRLAVFPQPAVCPLPARAG